MTFACLQRGEQDVGRHHTQKRGDHERVVCYHHVTFGKEGNRTMKWYTFLAVGLAVLLLGMHATQMATSATSTSSKGPETVTIDSLLDKYEPVAFSHQFHTEAVDDCARCHHTPPGETLACSDCHGAPFDPEDLSKPGLKGAYHRQCLGCHRDADSGPTGCTDCHAKRPIPK